MLGGGTGAVGLGFASRRQCRRWRAAYGLGVNFILRWVFFEIRQGIVVKGYHVRVNRGCRRGGWVSRRCRQGRV